MSKILPWLLPLVGLILAILFVPIPFRYEESPLCAPCPPNQQCPRCPQKGDIEWRLSIAKRYWDKITMPEASRSEKTEKITPPQNDTTSYVCPKNNHIDCMPIVHPKRAYQCEKDYLEWAKNNCSGLIITY